MKTNYVCQSGYSGGPFDLLKYVYSVVGDGVHTEFISGCVDELPVRSPVVVAEHLPYILNLHSIRLCVGKDLLLWQTPTLALGTTRVVVPTGSRPTGILILLSMIDTLAYSFTTHAIPGVGGGTGICPLIGLGPQRMDPVHVPVAKDRRCAPTTT